MIRKLLLGLVLLVVAGLIFTVTVLPGTSALGLPAPNTTREGWPL